MSFQFSGLEQQEVSVMQVKGRKIACLIFSWVFLTLPGLQGAAAQDLSEITHMINGKRMRSSSGLFDPESNRDSLPIAPGETLTLAELDGPGEIRHIWFTIGALDRRFTRSLVLRVFWDDSRVPSVESPIGDFFAAGNGMRVNVSSLPIEVTSYGRAFNSYWRMPFRKKARLTLTNESDKRVSSCYFYIDWLKYDSLPADALYFHARYRQEFPVKPFSPYTIAEIEGRGHYVGTVLSIQSSMGSWLGESDDRFYIDGEEMPSMVGTGMEDYFTDAWNHRLYTNLRAGLSIYEPKGPDQRVTAYRWHIADPVTFTMSLKVEMERRSYAAVTNPETGEEVTWDFKYRPDIFSSVAFWYASEPADRFWEFAPVSERLNPEIFIETTLMLDELETSPGIRLSQKYTRSTNAASGPARKAMTYVENDEIGGWLEVPVKVEEAGDYSISIYQMLFRDYGTWRLIMKGPGFDQLLDPAMDFYDPYFIQTFNMPENYLYGTWHENKVGIYSLEPGSYTIRFECIGANPLARVRGVAYTQAGSRYIENRPAGQPGLNMALDGISLRKLPWEDTWGWMQDYLVREERLFTERIETADRTVQRLAEAIEAFKRDTDGYPHNLNELIERPPRLAGIRGNWPYIKFLDDGRIPLDPWGQHYRFLWPGRYNTGGFDVWSVHGNERDPSVWIGNWEK
jgi:hypothetical protein